MVGAVASAVAPDAAATVSEASVGMLSETDVRKLSSIPLTVAGPEVEPASGTKLIELLSAARATTMAAVPPTVTEAVGRKRKPGAESVTVSCAGKLLGAELENTPGKSVTAGLVSAPAEVEP